MMARCHSRLVFSCMQQHWPWAAKPPEKKVSDVVFCQPKAENIVWSDSLLSTAERMKLTGCKGGTLWFTGREKSRIRHVE